MQKICFIKTNYKLEKIFLFYKSTSPSEQCTTVAETSLFQLYPFVILSNSSIVPSKFMDDKDEQYLNADFPIAIKLFGRLMVVNEVQPVKAHSPSGFSSIFNNLGTA